MRQSNDSHKAALESSDDETNQESHERFEVAAVKDRPVLPPPPPPLPPTHVVEKDKQPSHIPPPDADDADQIPDGGLEAWLQVLGSWVILVVTWGLVNAFGVYQAYYQTMLPSVSSSSISWIGSIQGALLMTVSVVSGPLYDAGYFRHLVAAGLGLVVLGQFMTSLCTQYWQILLAQGVMTGLGMGICFLPATVVLAQYFDRRRALVLGIASTGAPMAGIVIPVVFSNLEPRIGFAWTTRTIAAVLLVVSIIPVACMHERRVPPQPPRRTVLVDTAAFRDPAYAALLGGCIFVWLALFVPFFYLPLFAKSRGGITTPETAPYVVTMLNAGSIVGRVLPNHVADGAAGPVNAILACAIGALVTLAAWPVVHDLAGLAVFAVLYGAFSGGIVSLLASVVISLTPDPRRTGARMGMAFLASGAALLVGTPVAGAVLSSGVAPGSGGDRWGAIIGYAAGGYVVGVSLYVTCRVVLWRNTGGTWKA